MLFLWLLGSAVVRLAGLEVLSANIVTMVVVLAITTTITTPHRARGF